MTFMKTIHIMNGNSKRLYSYDENSALLYLALTEKYLEILVQLNSSS